MTRNIEAKITKQMRDLVEAKLKSQNISVEQAISDLDIFMQDYTESDKRLLNQYAKYLKHLIDSQLETKNAWEKFLTKVEEYRLNHDINKTIKKDQNDEKAAFKQSLEDLKEYDKLRGILKGQKKDVENITVENKQDDVVFNPFDEQAAAELADLEAIENDHDDWTINDEEFNDEITMDTNDLGTLERNIDFDPNANVDELKEQFSKIKAEMQNQIDELTQENETLKFKLRNYQTDDLSDYDVVDEDMDVLKKAQSIPEGQQTMDFSNDGSDEIETSTDFKIGEEEPEDPMIKTSEATAVFDDSMFDDDQPEEETKEPTTKWTDDANEDTLALEDDMAKGLAEALDGFTTDFQEPENGFGFDELVTDKDGNEYHVAGSRKTSENKTEYLVRNDDGETFTFNFKDLIKK